MPYNNLPPALASYFAGQDQSDLLAKNTMDRQELAQKIADMQAAAQQQQQMNPMLLEQQRLKNSGLDLLNQTSQAQLPGVVAQSNQHMLDYDTNVKLQPSKIATQLSNDQETQEANKEKSRERAQKFMMETGAALADTPVPMRAQEFSRMVQQSGIRPDHPLVQQFGQAVVKDPANFPKIITNYADRLGQQAELMSPQARSAKEVARTQADASIQHARITAGATVRAAELGADSRMEVQRMKIQQKLNAAADTLAQLKAGKVPPDRAILQAQVNYPESQTDQEREMWLNVVETAQNVIKLQKQAGGEGSPQVETKPDGTVTLNPKAVPDLAAEMRKRASQKPSAGGPKALSDTELINQYLNKK